MTKATLGNNATFNCSNGGTIRVIGHNGSTDLNRFGVDGTFAYYDDLHINAHSAMTLDVDEEYNATGTVQHVTGDPVMRFDLISNEAGGKADFKLTNLQPNAWYRLRFSGILAACDGGRAHGKTNDFGRLDFTGVNIPNE